MYLCKCISTTLHPLHNTLYSQYTLYSCYIYFSPSISVGLGRQSPTNKLTSSPIASSSSHNLLTPPPLRKPTNLIHDKCNNKHSLYIDEGVHGLGYRFTTTTTTTTIITISHNFFLKRFINNDTYL